MAARATRLSDLGLTARAGRDPALSGLTADKNVVIVFYPFAFSGICTGELDGIRDNLGEYVADDLHLLTISCDPTYALRGWADAKGYFFPDVPDDEEPAEGEIVEIAEDLSGDIEPDELDRQIADLQAALGYNQAKMTLRWQQVQGDKQAMLELLTTEYENNGKQPGTPPKPSDPEARTSPPESKQPSSPAAPSNQGSWLI